MPALPPSVAATLAKVLDVEPDEVEALLAAGAQEARDTIAAGLANLDVPTTVTASPPVELEAQP